jgi:hypothetical protein
MVCEKQIRPLLSNDGLWLNSILCSGTVDIVGPICQQAV